MGLIWLHYLKLMLGHAAYAQTLVLAIFMGGMAIGAWLTSHYSRRWDNLLLGYALAEGLIGLFGLIFHALFTHLLDALYLSWIPALSDAETINILKWSLAALLILPQSILLGATFPLMSAAIIRLCPATPGATLGMLYFTNSLGAATGVLVSVFVLIPAVGLPGTIMIAAILNILLALVVWAIAKDRRIPALAEKSRRSTQSSQTKATWLPVILLTIALCSSLASFFYEIGWIRMLSWCWAGLLALNRRSAPLFWVWRWADYEIAADLTALNRCATPVMCRCLWACALGTLPLYNSSFDFMMFMVKSLSRNDMGYTLFNLSSQIIAMVIMLPATFLAGMTLPLFTYALLQRGTGERSIGWVYSANTIGAIIGVMLAVHWVMPTIGVRGRSIWAHCWILLSVSHCWHWPGCHLGAGKFLPPLALPRCSLP